MRPIGFTSHQEAFPRPLRDTRKTISPKTQEAADKFLNWVREKADRKPRDPLAPEKPPRADRQRDPHGRFAGPRRDVEKVPRLPTFPARWVLEDRRGRPYFVFWTSDDDRDVLWVLKMERTEDGNALLVTLENGETYRIGIRRRGLPRGTGTALFYCCPWCQKPRRYLYLLTRSGDTLVDYQGLRCQACAGLGRRPGYDSRLASGCASAPICHGWQKFDLRLGPQESRTVLLPPSGPGTHEGRTNACRK